MLKFIKYFLYFVPKTILVWTFKKHELCYFTQPFGLSNRISFIKQDLKVGYNSLFFKEITQDEINKHIANIKNIIDRTP